MNSYHISSLFLSTMLGICTPNLHELAANQVALPFLKVLSSPFGRVSQQAVRHRVGKQHSADPNQTLPRKRYTNGPPSYLSQNFQRAGPRRFARNYPLQGLLAGNLPAHLQDGLRQYKLTDKPTKYLRILLYSHFGLAQKQQQRLPLSKSIIKLTQVE